MSRLLRAATFGITAISVAWLGAYVDTFLLPMDETSAHALGAPEFAYPIVAGVRVAVTVLGCVVFTTTMFVARKKTDRAMPGIARACLYGCLYSASIFGLGELAKVTQGGAPVVLMWVVIVTGPIFFGRQFSERVNGGGKIQ